ncbi:MAG: DUF4272 domain-containing protein, partial [Planctomycetota bacterium]
AEPYNGEELEKVHAENYKLLRQLGFRPAKWLGPWPSQNVRPAQEILARTMCLQAVTLWCSHGADQFSDKAISDFVEGNSLRESMTAEELDAISESRSESVSLFGDTIGWKIENIWPLVWVLGGEPAPSVSSGMIDRDTTLGIFEFLPALDESMGTSLSKINLRSRREVVAMHDLFYYAHNAVREAQVGRPGVPKSFDPIADGGTVHERRHALTWCLSPGVSWDDTELST